MSVLDDLAVKLVTDGVAVLSSNLFLGSGAVIPTGQGPYISLQETGGVAPTRTQDKGGASSLRPTVQVLTRASNYKIARQKALAAYQSLDGNFNKTINGTFYLKITARQEPTDMGMDASGTRVQIVFTVEAEKAPG